MENEDLKKTRSWILSEWITLMGTVIVCFSFLYHKIETQGESSDRKFEIQGARTDKLYEMFYEVVKDRQK